MRYTEQDQVLLVHSKEKSRKYKTGANILIDTAVC